MNENIFKALGIFLDELRPLVKHVIQTQIPDTEWAGEFFRRLPADKQSTWNMAIRDNEGVNPLNLVDYNNLDTFGIKFKDELARYVKSRDKANQFISCVQELKGVRNKCQHYQVIDEDESVRAFSHMIQIAKMFGNTELYDELKRLLAATTQPAPAQRVEIPATHIPDMAPVEASSHTQSRVVDNGTPLTNWFDNALPHSDIRNGVLDESVFAANINDVVNQVGPDIYLLPGSFFPKTFITNGLQDIAKRVVLALNGEETENRVISLQTGFGGGKTHTLISLYHLVKAGKDIKNYTRDILPENLEPSFGRGVANVAVFTQQTCDVVSGHEVEPGLTVYTLWGEIAYQLGGKEAYDMIAENDRKRIPPSSQLLKPILEKVAPSLILIDELADYCVKAAGLKVGNVTLFDQTAEFLQTLTETVAGVQRCVLLATLPASATEVANSTVGQTILDVLENRIVRIGSSIKPVDDQEIFEVIRRRLFESFESTEEIEKVVVRYKKMYDNRRRELPANSNGVEYANKIRKSYPFHPELIDMFRLRWGNDSRFQRTRGVLRLLASIVQNQWKKRKTMTGVHALIHTSDVELAALPTLTGTITKLMGAQWESVLQADVYGTSSNAYKVDNLDKNSECYRHSITQALATTLMLASVGDLQQKGLKQEDLLLCVLRPAAFNYLEVGNAMNKLEQVAHYLYSTKIGGRTYWFQSKPNINILLNQAKNEVSKNEVDNEITARLNKSKAFISNLNVLIDPTSDVPEQKRLTLVVLPPQYAVPAGGTIPQKVKNYIENIAFKRGSSDRIYRNTIFYLAPTERGITTLSEKVRDMLSCQKILTEYASQLDNDQRREINQRKTAFEEQVKEALVHAYAVALRCSKIKGFDLYELTSFANELSQQISQNLINEIKENEWLIDSVGRVVLSRNNLLPDEDNLYVKVSDIYEAFLKFDDKPMISGEGAIINTVNRLCSDETCNVGVGAPGHITKVFHAQSIPFLTVDKEGEYYLIDESVQAVNQGGYSSNSGNGGNGTDPSGNGNGGNGNTGNGGQSTPGGEGGNGSNGGSTSSNQPKTFKKVEISGNVPMENWSQLFTSFVQTLKNNRLQIEVKFTAKSTDSHPIKDSEALFKSIKESASQLGLNLTTEE